MRPIRCRGTNRAGRKGEPLRTVHRRLFYAVFSGALAIAVVAGLANIGGAAHSQPSAGALVEDVATAVEPTQSGGSSSAAPAPRPKAAARKPLPRFERRHILMRPPYDLKRSQVALTCGFHDSCKRRGRSYPSGDGLDWNDNNGTVPETKAVFFTASAHAVRTTRIARVVFEFHPAGRDYGYPCHTLVANVVSVPENLLLFRVGYQHVVPVQGLRPFDIVGAPGNHRAPNVVRRIATMVNDPCPFFSKTADRKPLYHVHVEPSRIRAPFVRYDKNTLKDRAGRRMIPDVNGCGGACDGPVYPGARWTQPYWALWTHRWAWTAETRTGRVRRT